jgi:hypothetical protein
MDEDERAFFLYWRGEFRMGYILKTDEGYIWFYARDLCLFTGENNAKWGISANFRELLKLWQLYREIFGGLDLFLPQWLVDFAVVYEIETEVFPLLLPFCTELNLPLLTDTYLYRRHIEENNRILFDDIKALVSGPLAESVLIKSASGHALIRDFETAVNAADLYLRENFRMRLFDFFFPPALTQESHTGFEGMGGAGHTLYTVECISFSAHPPLIQFLENLFRYTEYCYGIKTQRLLKGSSPVPQIDEIWKNVADSAFGFEEKVPAKKPPSRGKNEGLYRSNKTIDRLRRESDTVRELLLSGPSVSQISPISPIYSDSEEQIIDEHDTGKNKNEQFVAVHREPAAIHRARDGEKERSLSLFFEQLDNIEKKTLTLIMAKKHRELASFARKNNTMLEFLIDTINGKFLEKTGDLLIDSMDEVPIIQGEYIESLKGFLNTAE